MFIQNQIISLPNHLKKIKELLKDSDKLFLAVAYIRNSGVDMLIDDLKSIIINKGDIRIICSNDMDITQPTAIRRLIGVGVEVKICKFEAGTFHPKMWLSEKNGAWVCLVGSANFSRAAFLQNVEASIFIDPESNKNNTVEQSLMFFEYLWDNDKCFEVTDVILKEWQDRERLKREVKKEIEIVKFSSESKKVSKVLFDFIKSWIGISKKKKQVKSDFTNSLWRGWYIIPDQGYIDNNLVSNLKKIVILIKSKLGKKGYIDISKKSKELITILNSLKIKFKKKKHKTRPRDLFIRQEKNYLIRLGLATHLLKNKNKEDNSKLTLTESGIKFAVCKNLDCEKDIYTNNTSMMTWGGVNMVSFIIKLLLELEYISLEEFYLFVMHADSMTDLLFIRDLVLMFRKLTQPEQELLIKQFNKQFDKTKGVTAKNVRGNYLKHAKHTMSAIGWVHGLSYDETGFNLNLVDKNKALIVLENADLEA
ncbi:MAG: phospholipase D-like domain-containing protein [Candidatus Doudnabacteria bacterium]